MKTKDLAKKCGLFKDEVEKYIMDHGIEHKFNSITGSMTIDDSTAEEIMDDLEDLAYQLLAKTVIEEADVNEEELKQIEVNLEEDQRREEAMAGMLITSGFNFEGYRIVKYSGYISGDDAISVDRGRDGIFSNPNNAGQALTDSLVKIRRRALLELKEAAYNLGCNAVIGVDFDYITLDPQTANFTGGTTYLPYVFCVTANGNAVIIEKIED